MYVDITAVCVSNERQIEPVMCTKYAGRCCLVEVKVIVGHSAPSREGEMLTLLSHCIFLLAIAS